MILFSSFEVNNFVKFKGVEKEEYMVTSHRENGSQAGKRFGQQDHGTWLLNRMSEPLALCKMSRGGLRYRTKSYVMGGMKRGTYRMFLCHIIV